MGAEGGHIDPPIGGHGSLHGYLDAVFRDHPDPSEGEIVAAKKAWRRNYLSRYHKEYRKRLVQVSFRISRKQYNAYVTLAKSEGITVNRYIKNIVVRNCSHKTSGIPKEISILLLEAIDLIEESVAEGEPLDTHRLISILNQCYTLFDDRQSTIT